MKFYQKFFMVIGILATILTILGIIGGIFAYTTFVKPLQHEAAQINQESADSPTNVMKSKTNHPLLTEEQENMLKSAGIDPANLPTEVTMDQQECAAKLLGNARIVELMNGATPSFTDFLKTKECF